MSSDQNAKVAQGKRWSATFKAFAVTHVSKVASHHDSVTLRVH